MKNATLIFFAIITGVLAIWYAVDPGTVSTGVSAAFTIIVGVCAWVINRITAKVRSGSVDGNPKPDPEAVTNSSVDALHSSIRDARKSSSEFGIEIAESDRSLSELGKGIRLSAGELEKLDDEVRKSGVIARESVKDSQELGKQIEDGRRELSFFVDSLKRGKE